MNPVFLEKDWIETAERRASGIRKRKGPQALLWYHPVPYRHTFIAALCFLTLICIAVNSTGQTPVDASLTAIPPGVEIEIKAIPEIATVGDSLQIDLDIAVPEGYRVKVDEPESQMGDFAILDFFPGPIVKESNPIVKESDSIVNETGMSQESKTDTSQHHRTRIIAAAYKTGKLMFPSFPIGLKTPNGEDITLSSPPLNIEIQSVLIDENPKLKDLKKQAEIPESVRWMLWLIIAMAAALLGAVGWYYWRRCRKHPVSRSPEQIRDLLKIAESDLKELLSQGFPENGMVKKYNVLLSEIIKRILESGYEIHTAEKTTSEIMDSLHRTSFLETENRERIEYFLTRCDVVKFAKYVPSTAEHEAVSKDALLILEEAKKAVASRQLSVASEK